MLEPIQDLDDVLQESQGKDILIYKHSKTCNISFHARVELEKYLAENWRSKSYMIIVQDNRDLSNEIELSLGVVHQSPQLLVVRDGRVRAALSHFEINNMRLGQVLSAGGK